MATNLTIAGNSFVCVPLTDADFKDIAAIYVVLCVKKDRSWTVLDVGQTGELGDRIDSHERRECWKRNCTADDIWICVHRMPSEHYSREDREKLERQIRSETQPPCGKR